MPDLHRVRPVWVLLALSAWLSVLVLAPRAQAAADAIFAVRNVQVDVTADNVNIARDQAFAQAQRKALTTIFQRLTAHDQWNNLPKVSDSAVADLVLDIGVDQEKRSSVRYIATVSVRFKPDPIMRLLRNANIPYSEWRGQPIPVIPVAQTETGPLLWEAGNPWAAVWHSDAVQGLVQVQVPQAPAANAGWPDAAQSAAASQNTLAAYQQSLNSTDVLIAVAQPKHLAENQVGLEVTFSGIGPNASAASGTKSYTGQTGDTIETLMSQAVGDAMTAIDESYKSHNSLEFDHSAQLDVSVSLAGLEDWSALRRKLASATPVRSYEVTALSRTNASLTLHYVGDQKQLEAVFIENGLVLSWAGDRWLLQNVVAQKKGAEFSADQGYPVTKAPTASKSPEAKVPAVKAPKKVPAERRRVERRLAHKPPLSREARIAVWSVAFVVFLLIVRLLEPVLLPFLAGMAIAYFLDPVANRLERLGLSRPIATLVITLGFFVLAVVIVIALAPVVSSQISDFAQKLPDDVQKAADRAAPLWRSVKHYLSPRDLDKLKSAAGDYAGTMAGWFGTFLSKIVSGSLIVASVLSVLIITPIVTFYLLRDWHRLTSLVDQYLPRNQAETIREQLREIDRTLSGFVRGQALVCLALGCIYGAGLTVIGLDLGLLIGFVAGILSFVPYLGTITGLLLGLILALSQTQDWQLMAEVVAVFAIGHILEGYVLAPRLVGSKIGLHPVWMIFAILAGGTLFGFVGILLAVPVTAVLGVLLRFTLSSYVHSSLYQDDLEA